MIKESVSSSWIGKHLTNGLISRSEKQKVLATQLEKVLRNKNYVESSLKPVKTLPEYKKAVTLLTEKEQVLKSSITGLENKTKSQLNSIIPKLQKAAEKMKYFEKQSEKEKKDVGFAKRIMKHPIAFLLAGPGASYGASDANLGTDNLGNVVGISALAQGALSGLKGAKYILPGAMGGAIGGGIGYGLGSVFGKKRKPEEYE